MTRSKRPWKHYASIERVEFNSGDVKFRIQFKNGACHRGTDFNPDGGPFESLTEAEVRLNSWWAAWWPKQIKDQRPA